MEEKAIMKKITAMLMVLVMICSAFISVSAATEAEAPVAPKFVGAHTRVNATDSTKNDVRFVSTVSSLTGDLLGYEITATFVNGEGVAKSVTYSGETTQGTIVYSSLLAGEETKLPTDYFADAIGFYVFTLTGVPAGREVVFSAKVYVEADGVKYASEESFRKLANGEIISVNNTLFEDYNDGATSLSQISYGLAKPYQPDMGLKIENNKLSVPDIGWSGTAKQRYWVTIVDRAEFQNAVKDIKGTASEAYVVEMDIQFKALPSVLGFVFNGDGKGTNATSTSTDHAANFMSDAANGSVLTFRTASGNIYPTTGCYKADGTQATTNNTGSIIITSPTLVTDPASTDGVYTCAYVVNGARIDLFINGTWAYGFNSATSDASIKDDSMIMMWAQNGPSFIDNVKISIPTDGVGVVTGSDGTKTLSERNTTYHQEFNNHSIVTDEKYGFAIPSTTATDVRLNAAVDADTEKLNVIGGGWHDNWFVLADSTKAGSSKGLVVVDMDLEIESIGNLFLCLNNSALTSVGADIYSNLKTTGVSVRLQNVADNSEQVSVYIQAWKDDGANEVSETKTVTVKTEDGIRKLNVRFIANGNTYSLYIDGNYITTLVPSAENGRPTNENTYVMFWAEKDTTKFSVDNLNVYAAN